MAGSALPGQRGACGVKARAELAADLAADLEACEVEYANVGAEEPVDPVRMV